MSWEEGEEEGEPFLLVSDNNLCHHTTTQIGAVLSQLEGKMAAGQEKMETQLRELKTGLEKREERMETQLREFETGLEKREEKMEGKMVAGQEKMETQLRELKTGLEKREAVQMTEMKVLQESIQSLSKIAIAIIVAAVVLQGDLIKPLLAIFFKRLL